MATASIHTDDGNDISSFDDTDSAAEALLKRWMPEGDEDAPKEPSKETSDDKTPIEDEADEAPETDDEDAEKPSETDDEETDEEAPEDDGKETDPKDRKYVEDDNKTYVKVKVDGEDREVPVKDLKRLYGQEASLTRKSQEVATQRKAVDEEHAKSLAAMNLLLERARARAEPYSKINFLVAAKELEADELQALQTQAQSAFEEQQFLETQLDGLMQQIRGEQQKQLAAQAQESIKVLSDPKTGIPNWSEKTYDDIRSYAVTSGLPPDIVNGLVDAQAIKIIYKAMQYDKGKAKVSVQKTNKTKGPPTKIIKASNTDRTPPSSGNKTGEDRAKQKLARSGSTDDAAELFLKRWENSDN